MKFKQALAWRTYDVAMRTVCKFLVIAVQVQNMIEYRKPVQLQLIIAVFQNIYAIFPSPFSVRHQVPDAFSAFILISINNHLGFRSFDFIPSQIIIGYS